MSFGPKKNRACAACKRRKQKCGGGIPCNWCLSHGMECDVIDTNPTVKRKKRDESSRFTILLNSRELGLLSDTEISVYLEMYLKYCPLNMQQWNHVVKSLNTTKSFSGLFMKYASCAHAARGCGDLARANTIMNEARSFARQSYDDMSVESVAGFVLLSLYFIGNDGNVMKHYASLAASIFENVRSKNMQVPVAFGYTAAIFATITCSQLPYAENIRVRYLDNICFDKVAELCRELLLHIDDYHDGAGHMRLFVRIFSHAMPYYMDNCRTEIIAAIVMHVIFTDHQRDGFLAEITEYRKVEYLNEATIFLLDFCEIFLHWRSGNDKLAIELATTLAGRVTKETFVFGSRLECDFILILATILYEIDPILTTKLHNLAWHVQTTTCTLFPMAQCFESLSTYISDNLQLDSVHALTGTRPLQNVALFRMVDGILSLASRFVPCTTGNSLMSPEGMHTLYETLVRVCPPHVSPVNPDTDLPLCLFRAAPSPPSTSTSTTSLNSSKDSPIEPSSPSASSETSTSTSLSSSLPTVRSLPRPPPNSSLPPSSLPPNSQQPISEIPQILYGNMNPFTNPTLFNQAYISPTNLAAIFPPNLAANLPFNFPTNIPSNLYSNYPINLPPNNLPVNLPANLPVNLSNLYFNLPATAQPTNFTPYLPVNANFPSNLLNLQFFNPTIPNPNYLTTYQLPNYNFPNQSVQISPQSVPTNMPLNTTESTPYYAQYTLHSTVNSNLNSDINTTNLNTNSNPNLNSNSNINLHYNTNNDNIDISDLFPASVLTSIATP